MFLESPESYRFTLHAITAIASPLHVLGIYCILSLTPKNTGSAKWYLLNLHVSCILLDWGMTVLSVPYLILPALAGYPLGILRWFGVPTIVQTYFVITMLFVALTSIILIFENRFYQLYARNSSWRYLRIPFIVINYLLDLTHFIPACLLVPDQYTAVKLIFTRIPNLPDELKTEPLYILAIDFWVQIPFILMCVKTVVQICIFIGLINRNMKMESRRYTRSENTVNLQRKFLNAIKAQFLVFSINLLLPQTYIIVSIVTDHYNQFANNLVLSGISLHGINSTLIMLWAHKTYREFCIKNFKKIRSMFGYTSPVLTVSLQPIASITVLT